jgi:hypothetical protein
MPVGRSKKRGYRTTLRVSHATQREREREKKRLLPKKPAKPDTGVKQHSLVLTGEGEGRTYRIEVDDRSAGLSAGLFAALCALAAARIGNKGPVRLGKMTARRLRLALDRIAGQGGLGNRLISPVPKGKDVLVLPADQILVHPSFRDVPLRGHVDPLVARALIAHIKK